LCTALADLRARLQQRAAAHASAAPARSVRGPTSLLSRWLGGARGTVDSAKVTKALTLGQQPATPDASAVHRAALPQLAERLGLSAFERDILLLCVAMELDTRIPALCAGAQQDSARPYPTFALALSLFDAPVWDALSPQRPLRYWRLLDIHQSHAQPLISAALRADERIVNYIKGINHLDDRLAPWLTPLPVQSPLPPSQQPLSDAMVRAIHAVPVGVAPPQIQLLGMDGPSKQMLVQSVAKALDVQVYHLATESLPNAMGEQNLLLRLWQRECQLAPLALYLDVAEVAPAEPQAAAIKSLLAGVDGLVFVAARDSWLDSGQPVISVEVARPTPLEQREAWHAALGEMAAGHAQHLAGHFDFGLAPIRQVANAALADVGHEPEKLARVLWDGALARARPALDQLAQRIEPKAGWDDLQLPVAEKALLYQIADQVTLRGTVYDDWGFRARMNRGLGISALFAGESGTGKTMAAEVLAHALGLLLYRIDLSSVVSKYIGETEKNLRRVFDAAESG
ncbi:MAG: AAA family ATPase, partial [Rhodanobacter sp.]